jgi:hypothetical protein
MCVSRSFVGGWWGTRLQHAWVEASATFTRKARCERVKSDCQSWGTYRDADSDAQQVVAPTVTHDFSTMRLLQRAYRQQWLHVIRERSAN